MNGSGAAMGGAAGVYHAMCEAVKASGVIVRVEPVEFQKILAKAESPAVVAAKGGVFSTKYQYLTSYKGLAFYTKSKSPIPLGGSVEVISARSIWIPG